MAGFGLGLLFVAIWASAFTAIKGLVPEWPPLWGVAARFALVVPVLALVLAVRGVRLPQRGDIARLTAMGVFGTAGYLAPAWMASAVLPSGLVALLSSTAPLFVAAGKRWCFASGCRRWPGRGWGSAGLASRYWAPGAGSAISMRRRAGRCCWRWAGR
ncbi:EamA family transporter [Siccirubricoccus deserti]